MTTERENSMSEVICNPDIKSVMNSHGGAEYLSLSVVSVSDDVYLWER